MGIHRKSPCQLRLEARSRAYHHEPPPPSSGSAASSSGAASCVRPQPAPAALLSTAQLAARLHSRIARAAEIRGLHRQRREASARERVQHARRVAREQDAKRRAQSASTRCRSRQKLEVARARRSAQLELLAQQCRARAELVLEKVESVRESQQRREARTRQLIEHQLVDAAKRREAQTREMVQKLSARWHSVELVKDRVQRAKFIQRWYRRHVEIRRAAQQLRDAEQHVATVERGWQKLRDTGFEESMALLQQRTIAQAAQAVLRVLLPSAGERGASASPRSRSANFRVLLMAGMIAYHPKEIMSENYSSRLAFASRGVLRAMASIHEGFALELSSRELKARVATLEAKFAFYFESFTRWKERDAERLANELLTSYHEIFQLKQHYEASAEHALAGDGLHELNHQTERQLQQIRRALVQVVGKERAMERASAIERQVLESRARPPVSDDDDTMAESSGQEPDEEVGEEDRQLSNDDGPPTPQRKQQVSASSDDTSSVSSSNTPVEKPPKQLASLLNDRKLVHELILNPNLQVADQQLHDEDSAAATMPVDPSDVASLSRQVRTAMLRAFWDQVVASNDISTLLARADELRSLFSSTVGMRPSLVSIVDDALRIDALHALMSDPASNLMLVKARCDSVLRAVLDAEAPARNEETRSFVQSMDARARALVSGSGSASDTPIRLLVDFMAFAFEKVEQIRGDMLQAHIGMLGAYLQRHGVEYERKRVLALLETGELQLVKTQQWLESEMQTYWEEADAGERDLLARSNSDAFSRFYTTSVMALVVTHIERESSSIQSSEWPEAFDLDLDRIRRVRDAIDRMAVISSLIASVRDYLSRQQSTSVPREFFPELQAQLESLLASPGISGANLVAQAVDGIARVVVNAGELEALRDRLLASLAKENAVFSLFFRRAADAVRSRLLEKWRQAHPGWVSTGGDCQAHSSLAPFASEIERAALELWKIAKLSEAVLAAPLNAMVRHLVAPRADEQRA